MPKICKVLHVVNLSSFGGIQKLILDLSEELNTLGNIQCQMLATHEVDVDKETLPTNVNIIKVHHLPFFKRISVIFKIMKTTDIIHFHGPYTLYQAIGLFSRKKVVYTEHSTLQVANIKNSIKHLIQKRIFGKFYLEFINMVIFISEWIKSDLNLNNKNQLVIYNGLSYKEPKVEVHQDFILTIAARLVQKKRVRLAVELMHLLKNDPSIKLQVIGDGKELSNLKSMAGDLLDKTVFFLGYKENAYDIIASSDLYLMTTDMEGFGLVILEAMMSETLVLALADSGGPTEILQQDFPSLVVDDVEAMANAVLYWKNHPLEKVNVEKDLKQLYFEKYTIEIMTKKYAEVYLNLANSGKHN
ncbi:glycosyltransferase family 4 protein [Psychroserpens sp. BH13MA-6]